jgi:hypothetical protein
MIVLGRTGPTFCPLTGARGELPIVFPAYHFYYLPVFNQPEGIVFCQLYVNDLHPYYLNTEAIDVCQRPANPQKTKPVKLGLIRAASR